MAWQPWVELDSTAPGSDGPRTGQAYAPVTPGHRRALPFSLRPTADVVDMFGAFAGGRAGRSATRKYNDLSSDWFKRTFGRRTAVYAWGIYALVFIFILTLHLSSRSALLAGLMMGLFGGAMMLMPGALLPSYISNWQLGAWGEESTARELRKLPRDLWVVRHDVKWRDRANHDHIVAGSSVFVLNTKNAVDGSITIDNNTIRVSRLGDSSEGYITESWVPQARAEAWTLQRELDDALGFPVYVYPVIVVWAKFDARQTWIADDTLPVAVVRGDVIAEWIESRPADLVDTMKRTRVMEFVRLMAPA